MNRCFFVQKLGAIFDQIFTLIVANAPNIITTGLAIKFLVFEWTMVSNFSMMTKHQIKSPLSCICVKKSMRLS